MQNQVNIRAAVAWDGGRPASELYLVGAEDVGVVVEVTQSAESVLVLLELDKAVA